MTFRNCNLFKRSFTNHGLGFTFNNAKAEQLIKKEFQNKILHHNKNRNPSLMKTANPQHSLSVLIENNAEEVQEYKKDKLHKRLNPQKITVSLHSPNEPADLRSKSFQVPLGHSTTVYVTPKARTIDETAMELTESERECRLNNDAKSLKIFNIYTRAACLFECKMRHALNRCKCQPWDYPFDKNDKVGLIL